MRLIAKFGGTSLADGTRIDRAADSIAEVVEAGHELAVVASAMGSTTDDLLDEIQFEASEEDRAEIVSMGERTSVRMLKAALDARDIDAIFLEPGHEDWPIITDEHGEVDAEETHKRAAALAERMDGVVPVIAGFIAEDHDGNVTTLGRGGSDTTAVMLGREMDADEVVIVTDVEGVMTGDPHAVEGAQNVAKITVDELRNLSFRGAEVVAPSALAYKTDDLTVRVIHYQHGDLLTGGTDIVGQFENLIDLREQPLSCVTVAGRAIRNQPGILAALSTALAEDDINIDGTSSGLDSITFYVDKTVADRAAEILHEVVVDSGTLSSVTVEDDLAVIRITGSGLPNQPDVIAAVINPLAEARVGICDFITSATSVGVYIDWEDREEALDLIQSAID
ncbi:MAG: aspartate kinase [Halobacteriales archaeon]